MVSKKIKKYLYHILYGIKFKFKKTIPYIWYENLLKMIFHN